MDQCALLVASRGFERSHQFAFRFGAIRGQTQAARVLDEVDVQRLAFETVRAVAAPELVAEAASAASAL